MERYFLADFDARIQEIENFFRLLQGFEDESVSFDPRLESELSRAELLLTLKASSFLLLYNLAESSMRNSIEAIFDEIVEQQVEFDSIQNGIKKIILENLRKAKIEKAVDDINFIAIDIIKVGFDPKDLFSGNLDARKIKEIASKYGFSHETDSSESFGGNGGKDLVSVKNKRNDLAHGHKTFREIGREMTVSDLVEVKQRVVFYLRRILENVNNYLNEEKYKCSD